MMDFALDGVKWWSIIILDGYSRTLLAGAMAPSEASWAALMVLYTACLRYGAPHTLISDSGGAYISHEFEAVCRRLEIDHQTIISTQGESYMNLMETHFNIQRRLYDYQFSLSHTRPSWNRPIRRSSRPTIPRRIKASSKRGLTHPFRWRSLPRPRAASSAQTSWRKSFRERSFLARPTAMAA